MEHYGWSEGEPNTENAYVMVVNEDGWVSMKTANSSVKASYYCNQKSTSSNQHFTTTVSYKGLYLYIKLSRVI